MQKLRSDPIIFASFLVGLTAEIIFGVVLIWFFRFLPPQLPLLYSLPWGELQLIPRWVIAILPFAGLGILFLNTALSLWLSPREPLLGKIVMAGSSVSLTLLATTCIKIILLVHL